MNIYLDKRIVIPEHLDDFLKMLIEPYKLEDGSTIGCLNTTYLDKENKEVQFDGGDYMSNAYNRSLVVFYYIINTYFPTSPKDCFKYLVDFKYKKSNHVYFISCFFCDDIENLVVCKTARDYKTNGIYQDFYYGSIMELEDDLNKIAFNNEEEKNIVNSFLKVAEELGFIEEEVQV